MLRQVSSGPPDGSTPQTRRAARPRFGVVCLAPLFAALCVATSHAQSTGSSIVLDIGETTAALGAEVTVPMILDNPVSPLEGWGFGVCHDGPAGVSVVSVEVSEFVATSYFGNPPAFHQVVIEEDGWFVGAVMSHTGNAVLPTGIHEWYSGVYAVPEVPGVVTLEYCDTLGTPPVSRCIHIWNGGGSCEPGVEYLPGSIEIVPEPPHRRGDCNQDGNRDLADAIYLELYLFVSGDVPGCLDACDANDDGLVDIADAITNLMWLFQSGPALPEPSTACGFDSTPDDIGCASVGPAVCP